LTHVSGYDLAGAWSPDGSRIAFISDREGGYYWLYLMNPDGSDQEHIPLTTDAERGVAGVSWSPDNRRLVYGAVKRVHSKEAITATLFIVDLDTLDVRQLTDEKTHGACMEPDWSWDGEWIAMVCTKGTPVGDYGEVYIIRPDGSEWRRVTSRPEGEESDYPGEPTTWTWVAHPHWSPDGRQIVYGAVVQGQWNLYVIQVDGGNNRRLSDYGAVRPSIYQLP
jgi:Tol biopolymer transport system component